MSTPEEAVSLDSTGDIGHGPVITKPKVDSSLFMGIYLAHLQRRSEEVKPRIDMTLRELKEAGAGRMRVAKRG